MRNNNNTAATGTNGFTLLELAIVLVIISLVTGGVLSILGIEEEQNAIDSTKESMETIEAALTSFYMQNERLPCPAEADLADGAADFGIEENCAAGAPTGIITSGAGATEVWEGVLPVKSLGLPLAMASDGWGSRFKYIVVNNLAQSAATYSAYTSTAASGVIQILDDAGTRPTPTDGNQINSAAAKADGNNYTVAYALISGGKDKNFTYNRVGTRIGTCLSGTSEIEESENCDSDAVFRDTRILDSNDGSGLSYYDYVRWRTKEQLEFDAGTVITAGGDLPSGAVVAFNLATCPTGWSDYANAVGRVIVGIDAGGTAEIDTLEEQGGTLQTLTTGDTNGAGGAIDVVDNSSAVSNLPPYVVLRYCQKD